MFMNRRLLDAIEHNDSRIIELKKEKLTFEKRPSRLPCKD